MPYPTQWANYDPQKFMCCLCYEILDISACAIDTDGSKIDICVPCIDLEEGMKTLHGRKDWNKDSHPEDLDTVTSFSWDKQIDSWPVVKKEEDHGRTIPTSERRDSKTP